jgi:uncharacterized protein YciI
MSDEFEMPNGSLLIVDVDSLGAARQIADEDPYRLAGLFETVEIRAWNWTVGNPEAG